MKERIFHTLRKITSSTILSITVYAAAMITGLALKFGFVFTYFIIPLPITNDVGSVIATTLQFIGMGLVTAVFYLLLRNHRDIIQYHIPTREELTIIVPMGVFLVIIGYRSIIEGGGPTSLVFQSVENNQFLLIIIILVASPVEELLFRGLLQDILKSGFTVFLAIPLVSLAFSLSHVGAVPSGVSWGVYASFFFFAMIAGIGYEYTNNILVPIIWHTAFNLSLVLTFLLV